MTSSKITRRLKGDMERLTEHHVTKRLTKAAEEVQQVILAEYDEELVDVVTDRNSKTNPNLYREDFAERLAKHDYVKNNGTNFTLSVPDMQTFDFSGRLKVIETIMHGLAGLYVEINQEDYLNIYGKRPVNQDPLDEYVPPKERIYIVRYNSTIRKAEKDLDKKFVRYPFSNTPPIKILEVGDKYVDDNMGKWIEEALADAQKVFVMNYKGAKL